MNNNRGVEVSFDGKFRKIKKDNIHCGVYNMYDRTLIVNSGNNYYITIVPTLKEAIQHIENL